MENEKRLIDANIVMHKINAFAASVVYRGSDLMFTGKDSCNPHEYTRGYEQGVLDAQKILGGQPTVDAVEVARLGKLGRLMMPYKGCSRGRRGPYGCTGGEIRISELDAIEDVEGDLWIPVLKEDLSVLKARANNAVEVVHGEWGEIYTCHGERLWGYKCSQCEQDNPNKSNYCPNCGAKMMDGDGNE